MAAQDAQDLGHGREPAPACDVASRRAMARRIQRHVTLGAVAIAALSWTALVCLGR